MKYVIALCMAFMVTLACTAQKETIKATPTPSAVTSPAPTMIPTVRPSKTELAVDPEAMADIAVLVKYYTERPGLGADPALVRYAALDTVRFAQALKLDNASIRDMLALWHIESRYHDSVKGTDGKSWGITQVRKSRAQELRTLWKLYGVSDDALGSTDDPTCQVALGVMAYKIAFDEAKGDHFQALRRYNGGNTGKRSKAYKQAWAHAMRVRKARKAIFGL